MTREEIAMLCPHTRHSFSCFSKLKGHDFGMIVEQSTSITRCLCKGLHEALWGHLGFLCYPYSSMQPLSEKGFVSRRFFRGEHLDMVSSLSPFFCPRSRRNDFLRRKETECPG